MTYRVHWLATAEADLSDIWLNANDRSSITAAARAIDRRLEANPETEGESRSEGRRIIIESPLAAVYRVVPRLRTVNVTHIWRFRVGS